MRILIFGGRDFADREWVFFKLDVFHAVTPVTQVIYSETRGAEALGAEWANERGIPITLISGKLAAVHNASSSRRNAKLLRRATPDTVFIFPGGKGTIDMASQAKDAGVQVTFADLI